jgi:O-antigen ligase
MIEYLRLAVLAIPVLLWIAYKYPEMILAYYVYGLSTYSFILGSGEMEGIFRYLFILFFGVLLFYLIRRRVVVTYIFSNTFALFLGLFALIFLLSLAITDSYDLGFHRIYSIFLFGLMPAAAVLVFKDEVNIRRIYLSLLALGLLYSVLVLEEYSRSTILGDLQLSALGINPIMMGRSIGIGLIFSLWAMMRSRSYVIKIALLVFSAFDVLALLLTGTRQVAFSLLLCYPLSKIITLVGTYARKRRFMKSELIGYLLLTVLIFGLYLVIPERFTQRYQSFMQDPRQEGASRFELWKTAYEHLGDSPVFGVGAGGFSRFSWQHDWPHNIFLEVFLEYGFVGGVLFCSYLIYVLRISIKFVKNATTKDELGIANTALVLFIFSLSVAQLSGSIDANLFIWIGGALIFQIQRILGGRVNQNELAPA